ncbi:MAG: sulfite exporter TauE/SafE family protein [Acidimicrobiales bacterium]
MNLWSIFITGLFAGGASCAAVQGGLLVASVVRRTGEPIGLTTPPRLPSARSRTVRDKNSKSRKKQQQQARARAERAAIERRLAAAGPKSARSRDDVIPVAGFLGGKLASHTLLGALLGLFGASFQLSFRARALMQIAAGALMLLMAANILGVPGLRFLVPSPPARLTRLVRRTARSEAVFAPAVLGFSTVLIPCGVTLSVMFLAIASGSPLWGAAGMATFVIGTSPLFATIGFVLQKSAARLQGAVTKMAAAAIVVAGLIAINSGLILRGSSFTLSDVMSSVVGGGEPATAVAAPVDASGVQQLVVEARNGGFSPSRLQAQAGVPAMVTLRTNGTTGCTRAFVIPSLGIQEVLPETGETPIDLGTLETGTIRFTCSMGMYRGEIDVV